MAHVYTILTIAGIIYIPYFLGLLTTKYIIRDEHTQKPIANYLFGLLIIVVLALAVGLYLMIYDVIKLLT